MVTACDIGVAMRCVFYAAFSCFFQERRKRKMFLGRGTGILPRQTGLGFITWTLGGLRHRV